MSEIKVNNGNIEEALKRFKRQCARNGVCKKYEKENTMKEKIRGCKKKKILKWRGSIIKRILSFYVLHKVKKHG